MVLYLFYLYFFTYLSLFLFLIQIVQLELLDYSLTHQNLGSRANSPELFLRERCSSMTSVTFLHLECNRICKRVTQGKPRVEKQVSSVLEAAVFIGATGLDLLFSVTFIPMCMFTRSDGYHGYHFLQHHLYFGMLQEFFTQLVN